MITSFLVILTVSAQTLGVKQPTTVVQKTDVDMNVTAVPVKNQLQLSTIMLACRQLDSKYESTLDGERQILARIQELSNKEKTALPKDLIEIRQRVDDMDRTLLKLKQQRVKLSEEMGDILRELPVEERAKVIKELNLTKKVELYKNVMVIVQKEKAQKAKEEKVKFEMDVKDAIADAVEKGNVDIIVAQGHKKLFNLKMTQAQVRSQKLENVLASWKAALEKKETQELCRFQVMEINEQYQLVANDLLKEMRGYIKEAKSQRKQVWKLVKKGYKKTQSILNELKKKTANVQKKAMIDTQLTTTTTAIKNIKKNCQLKPVEKKMAAVDTKLAALINDRVKQAYSIISKSKNACSKDPLWKLDNKKALSLYARLDYLERQFRRIGGAPNNA